MTLESWRFRDPSEIIDSLISESARKAKQEKKRRDNLRKHKARRIRALVKGAMRGVL